MSTKYWDRMNGICAAVFFLSALFSSSSRFYESLFSDVLHSQVPGCGMVVPYGSLWSIAHW